MRERRPSTIETLVLLVPSIAFVIVLDRGEENGIGVFHQPGNDLLAPLLVGLVVNASAFYAIAFRLLPALVRDRRALRFAGELAAVGAAFLASKTLAHWTVIRLAEPSLRHVGWGDLLAENAISLAVVVVLASIYGLARRGLRPIDDRAPTPPASGDASHLDFWSGRTLHRLPSDEILYLEGKGNYVKVVSRQRSAMVYTTLRDQEARLCAGADFARIHRSYIVSLRNLETADASTVAIGGRKLPISESYARSFHGKLRARAEAAEGADAV